MLEDGAETLAGLVAVHITDGGAVDGAVGVMEALELGCEGGIFEQAMAQFGLDDELLGHFSVEGLGTL